MKENNFYAEYIGFDHEIMDGENIKEYEKQGKLQIGAIYPIKRISVFSSHSVLYIKGFNKGFNHLAFNVLEMKKSGKKCIFEQIDILDDERFNPYMKIM